MACCKKRSLWKSVAIFSMVVSCTYLAFSVLGLLTYHCIFSPGVSEFQMDNTYFTYVLYFYNRDCLDTTSNYVVAKPEPSERTWNWSITYLVVNSIWFFTSLLLYNAPNYWKTPAALSMTYPWLFTTFAVLCVDAAASVMYGFDYDNIDTLDHFVKFLGILFGKADDPTFDYFPVPLVIMVAIFSKLIVGWILVLCSFIIIYRIMININKPKELRLQTKPAINYYTPSRPSNDSEMREISNLPLPTHTRNKGIDNPIFLDDESAWESNPQPQGRYIIPRVTTRDTRDFTDSFDTQYPRSTEQRGIPHSWDRRSPESSGQWEDYHPSPNNYPRLQNSYEDRSARPWSYVSPEDLPPSARHAEYPYRRRLSDDEGVGYF